LFSLRGRLSKEAVLAKAAAAGLDVNKLQAAMDSAETKKIIDQDVADGDAIGVQGTPTIFINGKRYNGPILLDALKPLLDAEIQADTQRVGNPKRTGTEAKAAR
jgi:protein-disulfide isomerase